MGCGASRVAPYGVPADEPGAVNILLLGLDNAGKSTLCAALSNEPLEGIVPTVGLADPIPLEIDRIPVRLFDVGGAAQFRKYWADRFHEVHGLILMVDAADPVLARFDECHAELDSLVLHPRIVGKPLLVLANKCDVPEHRPLGDLAERLHLNDLVFCQHRIVGGSARWDPAKATAAEPSQRPSSGPAASGSGATPTVRRRGRIVTPLARIDPAFLVGLRWLVAHVRHDLANLGPRVDLERAAVAATEGAQSASGAAAGETGAVRAGGAEGHEDEVARGEGGGGGEGGERRSVGVGTPARRLERDVIETPG